MATVLSTMTRPLQLQSIKRHPSPSTFPRRRGLAHESRPTLPELLNVYSMTLATLALSVRNLSLSKDAVTLKGT